MRKYGWSTEGAKKFFSVRVQVIFFMLLCSFCALVLFSFNLDQGKHRYHLGDKTREDLVAPRAILDEASTENLQRQAVESVLPVEYVEPVILIEAKKDLERLFGFIRQAIEAYPEDPDLAASRLMEAPLPGGVQLEQAEANALAEADAKVLGALQEDIADLLSQSLATGVAPGQLEAEKTKLSRTVETLREYKSTIRSFGGKAASGLLRANRFVDQNVTNIRKEEARNAVEPVMLSKGTVIASSGTILNAAHIELLRGAGMLVQESRERTLQLFGAVLVILVAVTYITAYVYTQGGALRELRMCYLTGILMVLMLGIAFLVKGISPWLYPFGLFPMLVTLLLDFRTGTILNTFLCILIGVFFKLDPGIIAAFWFSGFSSAMGVRRAEQRSALFFSGITGAMVGIVLVFGTGFAYGTGLQELLLQAGLVAAAGILSSILLLGSMPVWEIGFKVLTPITLLELSNPNHPLLKKLLVEAPGTYHHSILVGNLSESAAHAVGANALLARVGSFYHDVGKVQMPHYFIENQMGGYNPHETLPPDISAKIIREHVENGLKLAAEYRLPKEIRDIIEQHHGSGLIRYFFHKASQEMNGELLNAENYSYSGKIPRTRESAIIMLADSVEAAVRSLPDIRTQTVKTTISKVLEEKLTMGQLSLCPLTFSDLTIIAEQFETILAGVYHERIRYPETDLAHQEEKVIGTDIR